MHNAKGKTSVTPPHVALCIDHSASIILHRSFCIDHSALIILH